MTELYKNKIIFAGCSFTWGQGLWSYWENKDSYIPTTHEYINNLYGIPEPALEFKDFNRFPWLVGLRFQATPIVKRWNGGTDEESVRFLEEVLTNDVTQNTMLTQNVKFSDIKYVVFQFTNLYRSPFPFFVNNVEYQFRTDMSLSAESHLVDKIDRNSQGHVVNCESGKDVSIFLEWLYDNNLNIEDFTKLHMDYIHSIIQEKLIYFENNGIKTCITFMDDSHLGGILSNDFFKNRIVKLNYNNKEYTTIMEMQYENPHLNIASDDTTFHFVDDDGHPSLECHQVIADSIINHIENL